MKKNGFLGNEILILVYLHYYYFDVNKWVISVFMDMKFVKRWLFIINNDQTEYEKV